ncbi:MAG: hypothetical protein ACPHBR_03275 [Flavobacteriales bacterium]
MIASHANTVYRNCVATVLGATMFAAGLGASSPAAAQDGWGDSVSKVDTLEVLVLLPFGLQVDTLPGGFLPRKAGRLREIAMESLHGVEAAARELAHAGLPVRLNVVDEVPDSLGKPQVGNLDIARCDLVLGPLMRENLGVVAPKVDRFGREQLLLTEQPEFYVARGPGVRQCVASELAAAENMARWVAAKHDTDNVVLVVTGASEAALESRFEEVFNAAQRAKWHSPMDSLRHPVLDTVVGNPRSVGALALHVTPYERNVVVSMAGRSARSMWAALQTELQMNDSSDFVLFAHPELAEMSFVEGELMERWRLTLPQTGKVQWADSTRHESLQSYRLRMGTEPQKYAALAHDALIDAGVRREPWLGHAVQTWASPLVWAQQDSSEEWMNEAWTLSRFADLQWASLDTLPELLPFVPRLFYDEEENVIPVPPAYRSLFPEEYPND